MNRTPNKMKWKIKEVKKSENTSESKSERARMETKKEKIRSIWM